MNVRNLSWLSKTILFILPLLLTAGFVLSSILQMQHTKELISKIERTDSYIEYVDRALTDDELQHKENVSSLKTFLNNELKYSDLMFDGFWLYKILLVKPDGEVIDIESETAKKLAERTEENDGKDTSEPISLYYDNGLKGGDYTLHIIELNSFLYKHPDGTIRQFPKTVVDDGNGERLIRATSLLSPSTTANNDVVHKLSSAKTDTASYSHLEIKFTLNSTFTATFELNWSAWWKSGAACDSLTIKPAK